MAFVNAGGCKGTLRCGAGRLKLVQRDGSDFRFWTPADDS
jgi:hypothetical protein